MGSSSEAAHFHWVDYLVFGLTLALSCSIGVYYGIQDKLRKRNTVEDFLLAGRSMNIFPVSVSMFVSWLSAISFIGDPVEVYYHGIMYWAQILGFCIVLPIVAHFFVPRYHAMKLYSAFEFLEVRFSVAIRLVASINQGVIGGMHCGFVMYGPAICLAQVTGISVWVSIVCVGVICIFYTTLGGMKAVLWADTVQSAVMFIGLVLVVVRGCIVVGGVRQVWAIAEATGRTQINFSPSPLVRSTFWIYIITAFSDLFVFYTSSQPYIQRYATVKTARQAKMVVYLTIPMYAVFVTLSTALGLVMVAYFDGCDPMLSGRVEKNDQIVPLIVIELLSFVPGLAGLFMASICCASLSTLSSFLNSLSFTLLKDIVEPAYVKFTKHTLSDRLALVLSKAFCVILGFLFIGVAMLFVSIQDTTIFQMTKSAYSSLGPLAALFFLGLFVKSSGVKSCITGFIIGVAITSWLFIGSQLTDFGPPIHLNVNSDNCSAYNITGVQREVRFNMTRLPGTEKNWSALIPTATATPTEYGAFWVSTFYQVSPLLYMALGFLTTTLVAWSVGVMGDCIARSSWRRKHLQGGDEKAVTESML